MNGSMPLRTPANETATETTSLGRRHDGPVAVLEAWLLGGPVDGRLMPVEVTADCSPPTAVKLPQTGFQVGAQDVPAPAVEHVYVLADALDDTHIYRYRQPPASEATD